jgi:ABC-type transport system involved in multi-copper enzyme maturation permease subunit
VGLKEGGFMDGRWGLGPVFASEWQTGSRSPRVYAIRAGFVLALLAVLFAAWFSGSDWRSNETLRDFAEMGASFYLGLVGTQLALILLAAPAATAGAICQERSRGTLTHMLVTDLSDPEIVLGKLAARLVPTFNLVLCALPVQFLASLLGGIDPVALMGSTVVTLGVAAFACSLALTFSVWARKTQEVLLATYGVLLVWLLAYGTASAFGLGSWWPWKLDPFQLALAPYTEPGSVNWLDYAAFSGLILVASAVLVAVAIWRFRAVAAVGDRPSGSKPRREWRLFRRFRPTLDADPILWREWHRARPSRWNRAIWRGYYALCVIFGCLAAWRIIRLTPGSVDEMAFFVIGLGSAIGLLLLSVDSATSLAEERARGSLDVLMTTPLSTRSIVWGKWRGSIGRVYSLAIMPTLLAAIGHAEWLERLFAASIVMGLMLSYGAAITSLGLALAAWVPRLGRAVALSVGIYVLGTAGLFFILFTDLVPDGWEAEVAAGSPFFGPVYALAFEEMSQNGEVARLAGPAWMVFYAGSAAILLLATLATFDRSLGRARVGASRSAPGPARRLRKKGRTLIDDPFLEIASHALQE